MRKAERVGTLTNLGTFLEFEVRKPAGWPRGTRAYFTGSYVVRPEPGERGRYRVDKHDYGFPAEAAVPGTFGSPEDAARALESETSRRGPAYARKPVDGLALLGDDVAAIALRLLAGKRALHLADGTVPVRATF